MNSVYTLAASAGLADARRRRRCGSSSRSGNAADARGPAAKCERYALTGLALKFGRLRPNFYFDSQLALLNFSGIL